MLVQFDLNQNDRGALLRHCQIFRPASGDGREDARLVDALQALGQALLEVEREQPKTAR
ncbi:hypothetical protein GSU75_01837 [Pseudomonas savastanoi pv. phaseolicola]|nr:hypothetical protein [Pseudomonas savastanoi pv. phaseolicola]